MQPPYQGLVLAACVDGGFGGDAAWPTSCTDPAIMREVGWESTLPAGTMIDEYEVRAHLASGGMADVYLVTGAEGQHPVALKKLRRCYRGDWQYRKMMVDEAALMKQLDHRNLVSALDIRKAHQGYFTMEYVPGAPLGHVASAMVTQLGAVPVEMAAFVVAQVADGLHYAHELADERGEPRNVVHRDVSMANVLIGRDGGVRVVDFGIAKARLREARTRTGHRKGNIGYMSPEQVMGVELDRRSDVFSMGVVLWELLTGRRLFTGRTNYARMQAILHASIAPPSEVGAACTAALDAVVMRALRRDRDKRYATGHELMSALAGFAGRSSVASRARLAAEMSALFGEPTLFQGMASRLCDEVNGHYMMVRYGEELTDIGPVRRALDRRRLVPRSFRTVEDCPNHKDIAAFFTNRPRETEEPG